MKRTGKLQNKGWTERKSLPDNKERGENLYVTHEENN